MSISGAAGVISPSWPQYVLPIRTANPIGIYRDCRHNDGYKKGANLENLIPVSITTIPHSVTVSPHSICLLNVRSINNKSFIIHDFIIDNNIDFFLATETWLIPGVSCGLNEALPTNYSSFNARRLTGRGGGLAVIYKSCFKCQLLTFGDFNSFEILSFNFIGSLSVLFILMYRPPKSSNFITEFSELLSIVIPKFDNILILGDFNIHICCPDHALSSQFLDVLNAFKITQSVTVPTHDKGHILDLILTIGLAPVLVNVKDIPVCDHKAVLFSLPLPPVEINRNCTPVLSRVLDACSAFRFCEELKLKMPPIIVILIMTLSNYWRTFFKIVIQLLTKWLQLLQKSINLERVLG